MRRAETRSYADRAEYQVRQQRARARGFVGRGALDRYATAIRLGDKLAPPAPAEDVAWAAERGP